MKTTKGDDKAEAATAAAAPAASLPGVVSKRASVFSASGNHTKNAGTNTEGQPPSPAQQVSSPPARNAAVPASPRASSPRDMLSLWERIDRDLDHLDRRQLDAAGLQAEEHRLKETVEKTKQEMLASMRADLDTHVTWLQKWSDYEIELERRQIDEVTQKELKRLEENCKRQVDMIRRDAEEQKQRLAKVAADMLAQAKERATVYAHEEAHRKAAEMAAEMVQERTRDLDEQYSQAVNRVMMWSPRSGGPAPRQPCPARTPTPFSWA